MILTSKEASLLKKYGTIIGVDEAGRGPLAGPIVAAAVKIDLQIANELILLGVNDSKKVTPKRRAELAQFIIENKIAFSTFEISSDEIDRRGIGETNVSALEKARLKLSSPEAYTIFDGRFAHPFELKNYEISVGADLKFVAVAAASIIAKTKRDEIMENMAKNYPVYGFEKHKGYGTIAHICAIKKHGPCEIHRKSFEPIKSWLVHTDNQNDI